MALQHKAAAMQAAAAASKARMGSILPFRSHKQPGSPPCTRSSGQQPVSSGRTRAAAPDTLVAGETLQQPTVDFLGVLNDMQTVRGILETAADPDLVYDILTDHDSCPRVFRNICGSETLLTEAGDKQVIQVGAAHTALCACGWSGGGWWLAEEVSQPQGPRQHRIPVRLFLQLRINEKATVKVERQGPTANAAGALTPNTPARGHQERPPTPCMLDRPACTPLYFLSTSCLPGVQVAVPGIQGHLQYPPQCEGGPAGAAAGVHTGGIQLHARL